MKSLLCVDVCDHAFYRLRKLSNNRTYNQIVNYKFAVFLFIAADLLSEKGFFFDVNMIKENNLVQQSLIILVKQ